MENTHQILKFSNHPISHTMPFYRVHGGTYWKKTVSPHLYTVSHESELGYSVLAYIACSLPVTGVRGQDGTGCVPPTAHRSRHIAVTLYCVMTQFAANRDYPILLAWAQPQATAPRNDPLCGGPHESGVPYDQDTISRAPKLLIPGPPNQRFPSPLMQRPSLFFAPRSPFPPSLMLPSRDLHHRLMVFCTGIPGRFLQFNLHIHAF